MLISILVLCHTERKRIILWQDSPPAWTQETYCPLSSKYSLCCFFLEGGVPYLVLAGVPHPVLDRGTPSVRPHPVLARGTVGYPLPNRDLGPITGVAKQGHRISGCIMRWRWGIPPERTLDQWKYYGMETRHNLPPPSLPTVGEVKKNSIKNSHFWMEFPLVSHSL